MNLVKSFVRKLRRLSSRAKLKDRVKVKLYEAIESSLSLLEYAFIRPISDSKLTELYCIRSIVPDGLYGRYRASYEQQSDLEEIQLIDVLNITTRERYAIYLSKHPPRQPSTAMLIWLFAGCGTRLLADKADAENS